jgi:hypothetical protein
MPVLFLNVSCCRLICSQLASVCFRRLPDLETQNQSVIASSAGWHGPNFWSDGFHIYIVSFLAMFLHLGSMATLNAAGGQRDNRLLSSYGEIQAAAGRCAPSAAIFQRRLHPRFCLSILSGARLCEGHCVAIARTVLHTFVGGLAYAIHNQCSRRYKFKRKTCGYMAHLTDLEVGMMLVFLFVFCGERMVVLS